MFFLKKENSMYNPLEQFEINSPLTYFSDFFNQIITFDITLDKNLILLKSVTYSNNTILDQNNYLLYFLKIKENIISYEIEYGFWFLDEINFGMFNNFSFLLNLFPTSDFFIAYHFLLFLVFFILYQNCFFFHIIKFPIKFIIYSILHFLLNTINNMNSNLIKYSPYLISLFFIILLLNILGLIPFVKSLTSTISITFFLSFSSFLGLNIEGALIHKWHFFDKFAPSSVPFVILPGLVLIELISYNMRPNSLAIRLFANMLAGHILIKLFITFCLDLSGFSLILFFGCFFFICILMTLEVFISFLQAYIFMFLVLLYLDDVINAQH